MANSELIERRLAIIRELAGKVPGKEIAERAGISYANLSFLCSTHGISFRLSKSEARKASRDLTPAQQPVIRPDVKSVEQYAHHLPRIRELVKTSSVREIATLLEIPYGQIHYLLARYRVKCQAEPWRKP